MIADADKTIGNFPKFAWWSIVYVLFCIIGVIIVVLMDSAHKYQMAVSFYFSNWEGPFFVSRNLFTDSILRGDL